MLENDLRRPEQRSQRQVPIGRPFQPGVAANPGGRRSNGKLYRAHYDGLHAQLEADGGKLTPVELALLGQAVGLLVRGERTKDPADAVKCANAAARILNGLSEKRAKAAAANGTLGSILKGALGP